MIIPVGGSSIDVAAVILMQNRDAVLERIARGGDRKGEAKLIRLSNPDAEKEAATMNASGWDVLCFVLPDGRTKYMIKNPEYLSIAEQIGQEVNAEVLRLKAIKTDVK